MKMLFVPHHPVTVDTQTESASHTDTSKHHRPTPSLTSLPGSMQNNRYIKVTIGVKPNHFVTLCQKFGLELIKKRQFHLPFIPAGLINVSLFHNMISTGLLNLIALLHSLILFLPCLCLFDLSPRCHSLHPVI